MKNNTNQIMKLDLPIWIKYWLSKHKNASYVLSEILTGTEFFLQDSAPKKFKIFDIIGRSVQDGVPTPENPVPIKNTGDNGSVNEKVQNKNILTEDIDYVSTWHDSKTYLDLYIILGTATIAQAKWIYQGRVDNKGRINARFTAQDDYTRFLIKHNGSTNDLSKTYNFNFKKGIEYTLSLNITGINPTVDGGFSYNEVMIVEGAPTDYVPHSEQNISFPLSEGQKLMEGDYLADDGVHHKMREIVLDGVTDGLKFTTAEPNRNNRFILNLSDIKQRTYTENSYMKSSHFSYNTTVYFDSQDQVGFCANNLGLFVRFGSGSKIDTITKANNWLAEHLPKFQYELAEEQTEDFTSEQQTAWKEWKKARTYKNITHISSEDETPAELKIQYYKEG